MVITRRGGENNPSEGSNNNNNEESSSSSPPAAFASTNNETSDGNSAAGLGVEQVGGEGGNVDNNANHNVVDVASAVKEATTIAERVAAVAADISQTLASKQEGEEETTTAPTAVANLKTEGDDNSSLLDQKPAAAATVPVDGAIPKAEEDNGTDSKKPAAPIAAAAPAPAAAATINANVHAEEETVPKARKKRVRRVGKTVPKKAPKVEVEIAPRPSADGAPPDLGVDDDGIPRILSKHDEKWNNMYDKLVEFKKQNKTCMVPQCYHDDPRLGRWVHYQRVEYWIYQQTGNGKITPERIARLDALDFEWDPQTGKWNIMYKKLLEFKDQIGHCKVPKGYSKDPELANWVRNQRLEHANMIKGKRSRMTDERFQKLDTLGFKWSTTMPPKMKPNPMKKKPPSAEEELAAEAAAVVAEVAARDNDNDNENNSNQDDASGAAEPADAAEPQANGGGGSNNGNVAAAAGAVGNRGVIAEV